MVCIFLGSLVFLISFIERHMSIKIVLYAIAFDVYPSIANSTSVFHDASQWTYFCDYDAVESFRLDSCILLNDLKFSMDDGLHLLKESKMV